MVKRDVKKTPLYTDTGYLNVAGILDIGTTFNFVVGARGTGKTYGILKYIYERGIKSIYLRRTQAQADIVGKADFTPFKALANDLGVSYEVVKAAKGTTLLTTDKGDLYYSAALSTFSTLRSFDMSDVDMIIFDEFIPEPSEKATIKNEYEAFLNMYETVNRNRELKGGPPVKLFACANANSIINPIFIGLNLIMVTDRMIQKGDCVYTDRKRGISLIYPKNSPISEAKEQTALYKLSEGSNFNKMALENDYNIDMSDILKRPPIEYVPIINVGELCVCKHKSRGGEYLVRDRVLSGNAEYIPATEKGLLRFKEKYPRIVYNYLFSDSFYYSSLLAKSLFKTYIGIV